jgi:hypothetical protein
MAYIFVVERRDESGKALPVEFIKRYNLSTALSTVKYLQEDGSVTGIHIIEGSVIYGGTHFTIPW